MGPYGFIIYAHDFKVLGLLNSALKSLKRERERRSGAFRSNSNPDRACRLT